MDAFLRYEFYDFVLTVMRIAVPACFIILAVLGTVLVFRPPAKKL